jgi:hemerythrin
MVDLQWKSWFEIGHERIDSEHRAFLNLIRDMNAQAEAGLDRDRLLRSLEEMQKYADFHFLSEENVMLDAGYPDLENHTLLHARLLKEVRNKATAVRLGEASSQEVVTFLYDWFCNHTVNEDAKIAQHLAASQRR